MPQNYRVLAAGQFHRLTMQDFEGLIHVLGDPVEEELQNDQNPKSVSVSISAIRAFLKSLSEAHFYGISRLCPFRILSKHCIFLVIFILAGLDAKSKKVKENKKNFIFKNLGLIN